ncbi:RET family protein [Megaselia abdita]
MKYSKDIGPSMRNGLFLLIVTFFHQQLSPPPVSCHGSEVYFPTASVKFSIPRTNTSLELFQKIPVAQFPLELIQNSLFNTNYLYNLEDENENFQINARNGDLFLSKKIKTLDGPKKCAISALNRKKQTIQNNKIFIEMKLKNMNIKVFCQGLKNLCFWETVEYTLFEDIIQFHPVRIGDFGPRNILYLCGRYKAKYTLINDSNHFLVKNNSLYTKRRIDHESLPHSSSLIPINVSCTVENEDDKLLGKVNKEIFVRIMDRNDHGPVLQGSSNLVFYLKDGVFKQNETIGDRIFFRDEDSLSVNTHMTYEIHNDTRDVLRPLCTAFNVDHTGVNNSAISCQLIFTRDGSIDPSPYCVILEAEDLSVESSSKKSAKANICIEQSNRLPAVMALHSFQKMSSSSESESVSEEENQIKSSVIPIVFPKEVHLLKTAKYLARVVQPERMKDLYVLSYANFTLVEDRSRAFGITKEGGIVYVRNESALTEAKERKYNLTIFAIGKTSKSFFIDVHLTDANNSAPACYSGSCSFSENKKQCLKSCALGSNGQNCQWRGTNSPTFSTNYATCVPEIDYCPDNLCDPLELLDENHCPQDCAYVVHGPHSPNENSQRGIFSASGSCHCILSGRCNCGFYTNDPPIRVKKKNNNNNKDSEVTKKESLKAQPLNTERTMFVCGTSCIAIAAFCPIVLVIAIICVVLTRKKYLKKTHLVQEKNDQKDDKTMVELPLVPITMNSEFKFDADSKWKFHKEWLEFDEVLGEGEFGKVVKAFDIQTEKKKAVAVKMLKTGANSSELIALLSEFQLLQDVSHPNVIKLIGASTDGDCPFLVLEYAKYGSLRSYLRLSRKLDTCEVDPEVGVEAVTVKDILSFAWQICKGMGYLTEIKLVHRDLAARNILLAEGKICKISDFGLTRDIYEDSAYLKRSRERVPVKWMAPESLADHVYTTKSDVWSFGILCWELITLGASPYPGIPPQNLYHLLKNGYRMERPENCSETVFSILRKCWADDPNGRPSFKYLTIQFESLMTFDLKYIEPEKDIAISNPLYCRNDAKMEASALADLLMQKPSEYENLEKLWQPPNDSFDTTDSSPTTAQSRIHSLLGYDVPRPVSQSRPIFRNRYENEPNIPMNFNIRPMSSSHVPHYAVPVKRGKSYMDMTNRTFISNNLDDEEEKRISKNINFRFSSLLNLYNNSSSSYLTPDQLETSKV